MYSADVRWLVVYKRLWLGEDHATVTEAFCGRVSKSTQHLIIARFKETGDVQAWQGHRQNAASEQGRHGGR